MRKYTCLEDLLEKEDLKWSFLSEQLGLNRSSISRWKSGATAPRLTLYQWQTLTKLLKEFEVDVLDISPDFFVARKRRQSTR